MNMENQNNHTLKSPLRDIQDVTEALLKKASEKASIRLVKKEVGTVTTVTDNIIIAGGLKDIGSEESVMVSGQYLGIALSLNENDLRIALLDKTAKISVGDEVRRLEKSVSVNVGEALIGRVVDPLGRPVDNGNPVITDKTFEIERPATPIMHRTQVDTSLETGIKVIDALIPIGRGQRELIMGDRQTGKTSIAIDTILHQKGKGVICVYCSVGQRDTSLAHTINELRNGGAMEYTIVVRASGNDTPGMQYIAPYAATSIGEYFMEQGKDVLVVYDDLTRHARAYRELSLLLERSPGREAYPGDIFYVHSRLLERSTKLNEKYGGGSLTALPIVETEAENLSAYIPTNLISITDGQLYLSPANFQKGILPAIDVGKSVSRVGSKAQLKAYKQVSGALGISYSQFEELESFSRFATKLDDDTQRTLTRGKKVREVLKQSRSNTVPVEEQIALFIAVTEGLFDKVEDKDMPEAQKKLRAFICERFPNICKDIRNDTKITDEIKNKLLDSMRSVLGAE